MTYGRSFLANCCRLLSSLNSGVVHQRPSVSLPLSKVGLELGSLLRNLGVIADISVSQRLSKVRGHARLFDPAATRVQTTAEAAGYVGMTLTLHLRWDKAAPLYSSTQLPAVGDGSAPLQQPHGTSGGGGALPLVRSLGFRPAVGLNSPTPESVRIISKPSAQRFVGLRELLAARRAAVPGIFLLSTHQGLLTDIDAELRGMGGMLLAHLGLPMAHIVQLRGLLRAKHLAELAAASSSQQPAVHVLPAQFDGRRAAAEAVAGRLAASSEALQYLLREEEAAKPREQLSEQMQQRLGVLELQAELARAPGGTAAEAGRPQRRARRGM